jgi:DNA-binding transcriptional ArsR family regulator
MSAKKRRRNKHSARPKIGGQWVPHQVGMIHLLRRLSLTARRILDTFEIEHCRHGGRDNGRLICTYDDFERGGAGRSSISRALRDLEDAGIVDIRRGRRAYADMRVPSEYTLTFEPTYLDGKPIEPTHDWKKQNTRPDSTTTKGGKPGRNPPLLSR